MAHASPPLCARALVRRWCCHRPICSLPRLQKQSLLNMAHSINRHHYFISYMHFYVLALVNGFRPLYSHGSSTMNILMSHWRQTIVFGALWSNVGLATLKPRYRHHNQYTRLGRKRRWRSPSSRVMRRHKGPCDTFLYLSLSTHSKLTMRLSNHRVRLN